MYSFGRAERLASGKAVRRAIAEYQLLSPDPFMIHRCVRQNGKVVDFSFEYCNPATAQLFGCALKELRGSLLLKRFPHAAHDPNIFERYVLVLESGDYEEAEVPHPLGLRHRTLRRRLAGVYDERIAVCFHDISGELSHRKQLSLVAEALGHRLDGQFSLIQALCNHTLSHVSNLDEFKADFPRRIAALAASEALLQAEGGRVCLRRLIERVLQPFGCSSHVLEGDPSTAVDSNSVLALTLAFHELAAAGVAKGQGSTETDAVHVRWRVEGTSVHIHWIEQLPSQAEDRSQGREMCLQLIRSAVESLSGGQFRCWHTEERAHHFLQFELQS